MPAFPDRLSLAVLCLGACVGCSSPHAGPSGDAGLPSARDSGTPIDGATDTGSAGASDAGGDAVGVPDSSAAPDTGSADTGGPDTGTPSIDAGTTGQWVMGYYVGYDIDAYPIASIDWTGLTHVIFSPLTVNADLSLNLSFSDQHGTGQADAMALSAAAHANGVKALLMLGGENAGANIATAASAANLPAFVTALVGAMTMLGYDGIDLDWEDSVNLDDLVSLAQALRAAKPNILLTYPGNSVNGNYETVDARMATLSASLDRFNVQTYYPSTADTGSGWDSWFGSPLSGVAPSTPVAIDDTLQRYAAVGVPKNKLGMGMAFYAICYTGGITGPRQPTNGTSQTIVGGDNNYPLSAFFAQGSTYDLSAASERQRDTTTAEPYLALEAAVDDSACGAATQYISYDDETSIAAKGTFSKSNGYGGIIVWTINQGWLPAAASGGRASNAMMQALKSGFLDP